MSASCEKLIWHRTDGLRRSRSHAAPRIDAPARAAAAAPPPSSCGIVIVPALMRLLSLSDVAVGVVLRQCRNEGERRSDGEDPACPVEPAGGAKIARHERPRLERADAGRDGLFPLAQEACTRARGARACGSLPADAGHATEASAKGWPPDLHQRPAAAEQERPGQETQRVLRLLLPTRHPWEHPVQAVCGLVAGREHGGSGPGDERCGIGPARRQHPTVGERRDLERQACQQSRPTASVGRTSHEAILPGARSSPACHPVSHA